MSETIVWIIRPVSRAALVSRLWGLKVALILVLSLLSLLLSWEGVVHEVSSTKGVGRHLSTKVVLS